MLLTLGKECLLGWGLQEEAGCRQPLPWAPVCPGKPLLFPQAAGLDHCFTSLVLALVGANPSPQGKSKVQVNANQGQSFLTYSLGTWDPKFSAQMPQSLPELHGPLPHRSCLCRSSPGPQGHQRQLFLVRLWIEFRHVGGGVCSLPAGWGWGGRKRWECRQTAFTLLQMLGAGVFWGPPGKGKHYPFLLTESLSSLCFPSPRVD